MRTLVRVRRIFPTALVLVTALASLLAAVPAASVSGADETRVSSVTITGRGFGHGHGLSQYAAQNRASNHGHGYRRILRFYYPGLSLGRRGGRIRVLISGDTTPSVLVRARPRLAVRKVGGGRWINLAKKRPRATKWRLVPRREGRRRVDYRVSSGWRKLAFIGGQSEFVAGGRPIALKVSHDTFVAYRGALRSARADTVNVLPLQQYVKGVVPREVPALWHRNAVRAQAVAARTYAARHRRHPVARHYQICDTTSCQAYGGRSAEHRASNAAVRDTARQVLLANGAPAFTQYSASNGGHTAKGAFGYLPGRWDGFDRWDGNPHRWWRVRIRAARVERAYPAIGRLVRIGVPRRDGNGQWGGRALRVKIVGTRNTVRVSGNRFRSTFGLRSTYFKVG